MEITQPIIAIQKKKSKFRIACLNGHGNFIRDFKTYDNEEIGMNQARQFFIDQGCNLDPVISRPKITKMVLRYG